MEYQIVRAVYPHELEKKVRQELAEGWEPLGGVSVSHGGIDWHQAMIRTTKDLPVGWHFASGVSTYINPNAQVTPSWGHKNPEQAPPDKSTNV